MSSLFLSSEEMTSHQALILRRVRDIPALPKIVNQIISLLGQPNTPASEIARLITLDPGLSSRVLRMVNSAAYGIQRQITSIQHAIMLLGFTTVRGLVLSASIFKLFSGTTCSGLYLQDFWQHCVVSALVARRLGEWLKLADFEEAFSAGLLHDIGKLVLDQYLSRDYANVLLTAKTRQIPPQANHFYDLEFSILNCTHASIGELVAHKWKLPLSLTEAIAFHHAPEKAQQFPALVHVVALANQLAHVRHSDPISLADFSLTSPISYFQLNLDNPPVHHMLKSILTEAIEASQLLLDSLETPELSPTQEL
ncbi:MAG: HDOD domain-containing protein [Vampirovibrionales bacterium]|nr:HDOD domain-containing protein [Vampirovibrionales bacterium]